MSTETEKDYRMKVFQKGQVVIPIGLRRRYGINIGDRIDAVPTKDGILIKPDPESVSLASQTDRLFGVFAQYRSNTPTPPTKNDVATATEQGFTEGWTK